MFGTIEPRPDRCELCRFGRIEKRYMPLPYGCIPALGHVPDMEEVIVCKRMPPVANANCLGVSPVVSKGDYCGEFKEKESA